MSRPPQRQIRRLLVANRGEIATRIISCARELSIPTYALYVSGDASHAVRATHAIKLPSATAYMNIEALVDIAKQHDIDAVHPGYGFLSESAAFAKRMYEEAGAVVVGPGWDILEKTGDKLKARVLAEECHVPVCPALRVPTDNVADLEHFASQVGYPIMLKAIDGGGGRGIRLVQSASDLVPSLKRAVEESPSKSVFAEKAAVNGFRHVEVQIIGDGRGNVRHLYERECSIQRRYQKIVELAPSTIQNRNLIARVIEDAVRMAKHISYLSLGTFEFLLNPHTSSYFFLEINPRLQVEHTITETLMGTDILRAQLLLCQGTPINALDLPLLSTTDSTSPPPLHSMQLRITAETPESNFSLSIGKITSFNFPTGNGIRVDTHLLHGVPSVISPDFDSLLAKLIISAPTRSSCIAKAQRAIRDTQINGIITNIPTLDAILAHPDFHAGECDTQWFTTHQAVLVSARKQISAVTSSSPTLTLLNTDGYESASTTLAGPPSGPLLRKGDAWSLILTPTSSRDAPPSKATPSHIHLTSLSMNSFPAALSGTITYTPPSTTPATAPPMPYHIHLASTTSSAAATTSSHRRADPRNASHIGTPFPGTLVEVCVDEGDEVREGETVAVVRQMKMDVEIRTHRGGRVGWVCEIEDGEEVGEGVLVCTVEGVGVKL